MEREDTVDFQEIGVLLIENDVELALIRFLPHDPALVHGAH